MSFSITVLKTPEQKSFKNVMYLYILMAAIILEMYVWFQLWPKDQHLMHLIYFDIIQYFVNALAYLLLLFTL